MKATFGFPAFPDGDGRGVEGRFNEHAESAGWLERWFGMAVDAAA